MTEPFKFTITITSDTICAWCYIIHVRLQKAIHLYSKTYCSADVFSISYSPYLLQPQLSKASQPVSEVFLARFGPERTGTISRMLGRIAGNDGIRFSDGGRVGDSRASHRVIMTVGKIKPAMQCSVAGEIMRKYFEQDGDITDQSMLIDCAVQVGGLEHGTVEKVLLDDNLGQQVEALANKARENGIDGVPHAVINGVTIEGAKDVEDLLQVLIDIKNGFGNAEGANEVVTPRQCKDGVCV